MITHQRCFFFLWVCEAKAQVAPYSSQLTATIGGKYEKKTTAQTIGCWLYGFFFNVEVKLIDHDP